MASNGGFDWTTFLTALGSAGAQYGMDRTKQHQSNLNQEALIRSMEDANTGYLDKLRALYAPELSGELQASELAAREKLVGNAQNNAGANQARTAQAFSRAGVTGGKVAGQAVQSNEQALQDYISNLDASLVAGADSRRAGALNTLAQVEGQNAMQLAPLEGQLQAGTQALGDYNFQDMQQYLAAPLLMALLGGGTNKFQGEGTVDTGAMVRKSSLNPLLERFGMNTEMFARPDEQLPIDRGGTRFTPAKGESDFWGNQPTVYDKSITPEMQAKLGSVSTADAAKLSDFDLLLNSADKKNQKQGLAAKQAYIERRNLIGQTITLNGRTKTYVGNGVWK